MCFPDFIGLRPLGLPFCARPGRKKYRSVARMIFFCPAKPLRAALRQKAGNPRPLPLKSGKTDSFLYGYKKMQTFRPAFFCTDTKKCRPSGLHFSVRIQKNADLPACILMVILIWMLFFFCGIGIENVISHFLGESPDPVQEVLSGYHSAFKSGQLFFPVCGE